jgi:hypothetical protein
MSQASLSSNTGFNNYAGDTNMFRVHQFMDIKPYQLYYFINQIGDAAISLGVGSVDVDTLQSALTNDFGFRCSSNAAIVPAAYLEPQSICQDESCPVAPNGNGTCTGASSSTTSAMSSSVPTDAVIPPSVVKPSAGSHVGAIAGGIVGGIVAIGLIVALVINFRRKGKKKTSMLPHYEEQNRSSDKIPVSSDEAESLKRMSDGGRAELQGHPISSELKKDLALELSADDIAKSKSITTPALSLKEVVPVAVTLERTPSITEKEVVESVEQNEETPVPIISSIAQDELAHLTEEQARIAERRKRLEEIHALEVQEEQVRKRMLMLQSQS